MRVIRNPAVADIHFRKDGQCDVNAQFQESLSEPLRNTASALEVTGLKVFDPIKEVEALLASTYAVDDKALLLLTLPRLHEEHREYPYALLNLTDALYTLKNKTLIPAMLYCLVPLSILHGELPPGEHVP